MNKDTRPTPLRDVWRLREGCAAPGCRTCMSKPSAGAQAEGADGSEGDEGVEVQGVDFLIKCFNHVRTHGGARGRAELRSALASHA